MKFGEAFELIKQDRGTKYGMRLPQWKPDVIIKTQHPDEHSKMTAPYPYVESRFGRVPWKETNIEMFSENWEVHDLRSGDYSPERYVFPVNDISENTAK